MASLIKLIPILLAFFVCFSTSKNCVFSAEVYVSCKSVRTADCENVKEYAFTADSAEQCIQAPTYVTVNKTELCADVAALQAELQGTTLFLKNNLLKNTRLIFAQNLRTN